MTRDRIVATHAGSLVRPDELLPYLRAIEHPELVAERLSRFASLVGPENIAAGTDCGFALGPYIQRVHPSIMWAKLASLAEGAALATKREFG